MLSRHPQIYMPNLKEPRFLAEDMRPRAEHAQGPREEGYPKTLDEYLHLFDGATAEQRVGEATPTYLWSRTAADTIAELQPAARIIVLLREPASFLCSLHLAFLKGRNETERDLSRAMSLEGARRNGRHIPRCSHRPQLLQYSEHVRYVEQLQRYHARFPPEQILVLIYDDYRRDNEATLRRVLGFLEVDDSPPIDLLSLNVTKSSVRSFRVKELSQALTTGGGPASRTAKATAKALTTRRLRRGLIGAAQRRNVTVEPRLPDARFMLELRRRFKPEVLALSEHLDRDLVSLWGYGEID